MTRMARGLSLLVAAVVGAVGALQWKALTEGSEERAEAHRVLDLVLERTTRAEAEQWAASRGGRCTSGQKGLRCSGLRDLESVTFGFDGQDRLVMVDLAVATPDPSAAARMYAERSARLEGELGASVGQRGEPTADYLTSALLREAARSYRTRAVAVELTALQAGQGRFLVREHHQTLGPR